jgi:cytochrome bd-I ubiquinol oxidase subunit X
MWYFSWILGTALALAFGVLNAMWYELMDRQLMDRPPEQRGAARIPAGDRSPPASQNVRT